MAEVILASASPRRQELLHLWLDEFTVIPAGVDESRLAAESPADYVQRIARKKADAISAVHANATVLAADTTVALGDKIFGKPADAASAHRYLSLLSDTVHEVLTAVVVKKSTAVWTQLVRTQVEFDKLSASQIIQYCATDEPYDKAGAYGIQGQASRFVKTLTGSYSAVVGLPLVETAALLRQAGVVLLGDT